jgi:hypothetical protein
VNAAETFVGFLSDLLRMNRHILSIQDLNDALYAKHTENDDRVHNVSLKNAGTCLLAISFEFLGNISHTSNGERKSFFAHPV